MRKKITIQIKTNIYDITRVFHANMQSFEIHLLSLITIRAHNFLHLHIS